MSAASSRCSAFRVVCRKGHAAVFILGEPLMSTRNHIKLGTHIVTRVVVKKSTPPRSSPRFLLSPPLPCSAWSRSAPPPPPLPRSAWSRSAPPSRPRLAGRPRTSKGLSRGRVSCTLYRHARRSSRSIDLGGGEAVSLRRRLLIT